MGILFSVLRLISMESASEFLFKRMVDIVLDAQEKIKNIKEYASASREAEGDVVLELLAFSYFTASKIIATKLGNRKNTKEILTLLFEKIIADITQHKNARLKYHTFHDYFDQVFSEHCEDYEKYDINVGSRRRIATIVTGKIARIYGNKNPNELIHIIDRLFMNIVRLVS
ncbi:MAG: hypothetical protein JW800_06430 [Candidatus Omnitrophica bacterium]|nr:hypothetical protein [Candidatus Omnitrophota bacterium]